MPRRCNALPAFELPNKRLRPLMKPSTGFVSDSIVCLSLSLIISIPVVDIALKAMWRALMMEYSGWMNMDVPLMVYAETIALGVVTYALVALALKRKAGKVPMDEALKNVE